MEAIADMKNYIQSRQKKGKTPKEIMADLEGHGYDEYAARGLVMRHWKYPDEDYAR